MLTNVKTFALLMLTAGLALGVFAGSLIASPKQETIDGLSRTDAAIEARLAYYEEVCGLDSVEKDLLRHELVRLKRNMRDELVRLWRQNQHRFDTINRASETRVLRILGDKASKLPQPDAPERK